MTAIDWVAPMAPEGKEEYGVVCPVAKLLLDVPLEGGIAAGVGDARRFNAKYPSAVVASLIERGMAPGVFPMDTTFTN